jgi:amino acid permease
MANIDHPRGNEFISPYSRWIFCSRQSLSVACPRNVVLSSLANAQGFACGWAYWAAYIFAFPDKLIAAQKIMAFWLPRVNSAVWISIFYLVPFLFNLFNVRRYGEIEFWLTVVKVVTIVGIIFLGILLPMGASPSQQLLGTFNQTTPIVCPPNPSPGECVSQPGFNCNIPSISLNI